MANYLIFRTIGIILIVLSGISGFALFGLALRSAIIGGGNIIKGPGLGTLWGLFIICLVAGFLLLFFIR